MGWPKVQQAFQIERIGRVKEKTREVLYGFASLAREEVSPERLLELCRGPCSIENESFYVREMTLGGGSLWGSQGSVAAGSRQPTLSGGAFLTQ